MLKHNDIITRGNETRRVMGVCDEIVFLSHTNNYKKYSNTTTEEMLASEGWQFPKEKWVPKGGQSYYYINRCNGVTGTTNNSGYHDLDLISAGNCFRTKEEAEAKALLIKEVLSK